MTTSILEHQALDVDVTFENVPEDTDPAYIGVAKVTYAVAALLDELAERHGLEDDVVGACTGGETA